MNYSTLKRGLAVSMLSLAGVATVATAQETQTSTSESNAKVFGGRKQYRTWSIGVHAGALMPNAVIGGPNDYTGFKPEMGYGINITKQLGHSFALQLNGLRGDVSSHNERRNDNGYQMMNTFVAGDRQVRSNTTSIQYAVDLKGVINVATIDFLRRKNSVNFLVSAGYGYMAFAPATTLSNQMIVPTTNKGTFGSSNQDGKYTGGKDYVKGFYVPVGVGVKFRVSNRVNFDLGYTMNFVDDNKFDGARGLDNPKRNDRFSYAYAGLNFSLGSKDKEDLQWINPLALMYDELKDESLRKEVEALKGRVANVEQAVEGLKKDSDGDGVADQFDKCPGTPAGTAVDGSGCPLPKLEAPTQSNLVSGAEVSGWENVQFDWNSYVLKTESYPTLDKLSGMLRDDSALKVLLKGYASSEGTPAYNLQLSKDRSNSVKSYLINSGVKATQLSTKGFGTKNPIASNDTEDGRIRNRRVEIARN